MARSRFWENKQLAEFTPREWERLCDGCALCCLHKQRNAKTGQVRYLPRACQLLNLRTCRCTRYADRHRVVPNCAHLTPTTLRYHRGWLPSSCAYRLLAEGKSLPPWHPLVTGRKSSTRAAGMSAHNRAKLEIPTGV